MTNILGKLFPYVENEVILVRESLCLAHVHSCVVIVRLHGLKKTNKQKNSIFWRIGHGYNLYVMEKKKL